MIGIKTRALRRELDAAGIEWVAGATVCGADGKPAGRVNEDSWTCAYATPGDAATSVTFEEEGGELFAVDSLTPQQCAAAMVVAAAMAAGKR